LRGTGWRGEKELKKEKGGDCQLVIGFHESTFLLGICGITQNVSFSSEDIGDYRKNPVTAAAKKTP
jgi:hypothetical protein